MAERTVSWQALANFSSIAKEAKKARQELEKLRREQQALDAANRSGAASAAAPGTAKAAQANTAAGNAAAKAARDTEKLNDAQREQVRTARAAEQAARGTAAGYDAMERQLQRGSSAQRDLSRSSNAVTGALQREGGAARSASGAMSSASASTRNFARTSREAGSASDGASRGVNNLSGSVSRFGNVIKKDQVTLLGLVRAFSLLKLPAIISGINALAAAVPSLTAGFIGLAGAIAPVTGLLGALPGLFAAVGGGIGTLVAGFAGIGGALKAYSAQQKAAATTTARSAKAAQTAANRQVAAGKKVRKANAQVAQAEERAADVAKDNARRLADARRAVSDARRREAEVAVQSSRQIASASRSLTEARRNEAEAERDITEARRTAMEQIDDLRKSLRDLRLEEEGAALSVEEARLSLQRTLNDPASTDLERRQAAFNVKEAEARLNDVKEQKAEADKALTIANKKGIEGSDEVVAAKRREADAHRATIDAERNLKETRYDAAQAAKEAARSTADAQRNLRQAQEDAARATRDAAQSVQDAKTGLGDLGDIMTTSTIPAVNQFREAMKKLTPEARAVVMQLIAMKPLIDKIRATAQKGLLPGFLVFLKESVKLFPLFNSFVGTVAQRFGDFFESIGKAMTTQTAMKSWEKILDSTARVIDSFTDAGENLVYVLGDILEAGGPLTEWLAETVEGWTASWRAMTEGEKGQERLTAFFADARRVASQLGRIIYNVANALFEMGQAFRPVGQFILDGIENLTKKWSDWTESIEGKNAMDQWAKDAIVTLGLMWDIIEGIVGAFRRLGERVEINDLLIIIRDRLIPALEGVMGIFTGEFLHNMIIFASNIGDIITALGPEGINALGLLGEALVLVSGALASFASNKAGAAVLATLLGMLVGKKLVGVVGTLTGVNNILKSGATVAGKKSKGGGFNRSGRGGALGRGAATAGAVGLNAVGLGGLVPKGPKKAKPGDPKRAAPGKPGATAAPRRGAPAPAEPRRAAPGKPAGGGGGARRAVGGAAGGAAGIAAAASFLPGPIGAAAGKLTLLLTVVQLLGPALGKLAKIIGGGFLKVISAIGPAITKFVAMVGGAMMKIAGIVAKAMLIIGRAMLANPWMLLIAAIIIVVVLIIKYWDEIKAAVVSAVTWLWTWLKENWPLLLKILLGPLGFLIVAIVKHWDKIKEVFFAAVNAVINWVKENWGLLLILLLGPLGLAILLIVKYWEQIKKAFFTAINAIVNFTKRVWSFIRRWLIDPLAKAFAWIGTKLVAFKDNFLRGLAIIIALTKRAWSFIYRWFIEPLIKTFAWIWKALTNFRNGLFERINNIIQGIKDRWNKFKGIVTKAFSDAHAAATRGLKGLRDLVSKWMGKIGDAWDKFKNAAKTPINWVIRHVINGGILKAFNWVAERLPGIGVIKGTVPEIATGGVVGPQGFKQGGQIPKNRAGGVLRGPGTGTSDSILGINARGVPTARVSNGEYVVNEKATKKNMALLDAINKGKLDRKKAHSGPGYEKTVGFGKATGGLVGFGGLPGLFLGGRAPIGGAWNRHSDYSFATWAGDNPAPRGTPVRAWKDGQTAQANRWNYSYGNHVRINHGGEQSVYAHLSAILTRVGEKINAGEIIGLVGSSGNSTGPHLHFEVRGGSSALGKDTGLLSRLASIINGPKEFADRVAGPFKDMKDKLGGDYMSKMAMALPETLKDAAASEIKKKWEEAKANLLSAGFGAGDPGGTSGHNQALGKKLMLAAGFPESQWPYLKTLWQNESGWNNKARNPSSGAYGIPQALPASKMGPAGASGNAEAQIKWGLRYIKDRYGTPSMALARWKGRSPHWYARGTKSASPGYAIVGENGPEAVRFKGGEQVVPNSGLPGYHEGGEVAGFKKNAKGAWVRAIRAQIPSASSSQTITPYLMDWFKKNNIPPVRSKASFKKDEGMLAKLASALKKSSKGLSMTAAGDKIGRDPYWLWLHWSRMTASGLDADLKKRGVSTTERKTFLASAKTWGARRNADVKALRAQLKLPAASNFDTEVAQAVAHAMDHAAGHKVGTYGHEATDPIPWDVGAGGLAGALAEQIRTNQINAEFDRLIETFRGWGLNALVTRFTELGPADGLTIMREMAANKTKASEYNAAVQVELDRAAKAEDPTEQQLVKFMEAVRAGTRVGLQGASSAAGVAIDTGVKLYDMITSQGRWGTIPSSQWGDGSRLKMDVEQFRNLFKFAGGGSVPGFGSGDSVPSMLTPGEFVLRRNAASAIKREQGSQALDYLNHYDKFANGGYVAAGMGAPELPTVSSYSRSAGAHKHGAATKVVNYNFNTEVHNPIAEPASVSVQKRVQRVARLGLLAGDDKESHR